MKSSSTGGGGCIMAWSGEEEELLAGVSCHVLGPAPVPQSCPQGALMVQPPKVVVEI